MDRLATLRRYDILDTPPENAFDRITSLATRIFQIPYAVISLIDDDRIWFKSKAGLSVPEVLREPGLCASVIDQDGVYLVESARTDARSQRNSLVTAEFGLQFYAGAPLTTHEGFRLGSMCIFDQKPRTFDPSQSAMLADLAAIVMDELELRLASKRVIESLTHLRLEQAKVEKLEKVVTICAWSKKVRHQGQWIRFEDFLVESLGVKLTHGITDEIAQQLLREAGLSVETVSQ
ncbi:GAF domain-containing protein [Tuwongella immobilis]|nr:GAF domain-containing protein [Tuwongella immobilis]